MTDVIDGRLWIEYRPVRDVIPAGRNPKQHDLPMIKSSIERFGFADAIVEDARTGKLLGGHGRLEALRALEADGWSPPRHITLDAEGAWQVPVQVGYRSRNEAEAESLLLALNRATELGGWDTEQLGALFRDLHKVDPDLGLLTGYDAAQIDSLMSGTAPDPATAPPSGPVTHTCPKCGALFGDRPAND